MKGKTYRHYAQYDNTLDYTVLLYVVVVVALALLVWWSS